MKNICYSVLSASGAPDSLGGMFVALCALLGQHCIRDPCFMVPRALLLFGQELLFSEDVHTRKRG